MQIGDIVEYSDAYTSGQAPIRKIGTKEEGFEGFFLVEIGRNERAYYNRQGVDRGERVCRWYEKACLNLIELNYQIY